MYFHVFSNIFCHSCFTKKMCFFSKVHIFYIVPLQGQGVNSPSIRVYGRRPFEGAGILVFKVIFLLSKKRITIWPAFGNSFSSTTLSTSKFKYREWFSSTHMYPHPTCHFPIKWWEKLKGSCRAQAALSKQYCRFYDSCDQFFSLDWC